jgi:hypothetical protein
MHAQMLKRYFEIGFDVGVAGVAYYLFGWIGLALWMFFVVSVFGNRLLTDQQVIMNTLLSRLPDRCAMCHREIVDEGGIVDENGIYHEACSEKLDVIEERRRKVTGAPEEDAG